MRAQKEEPWDAFLFSVALLLFARFWGLPSSLWTRICTREGGRGKGKPSQLEDWKSLKPKPPQPRGGWWGCAKREEFIEKMMHLIENHEFDDKKGNV